MRQRQRQQRSKRRGENFSLLVKGFGCPLVHALAKAGEVVDAMSKHPGTFAAVVNPRNKLAGITPAFERSGADAEMLSSL
jgi:hypothetical protein